MKRSRLVGFLLVAAPVVVSCQLFLDIPPLRLDPDPDAQPPVDPCAHALPPAEPPSDDDTETANDYWFATERIIIPEKEVAGAKVGLDLDDSCTCQRDLRDGAAPCEPPSLGRTTCDFDGGIDDSLGALAARYVAFLQDYDIADVVNRRIQSGHRTTLIYVTGYNGKANDREVGVAMLNSGGLYDDGRCGEPAQPLPAVDRETLLHAPRWDGCDRWSPTPGLLFGTYPTRKTTTTPAYVSNYKLVARVQSISADFLGEGATMTHAIALATFSPDPDSGGGLRLEGFIAGRIPFADTAAVVARADFSQGDERMPLCASPIWPSLSSELCSMRDTMQSASREFQGNVCDAVTATIGFVARPVQVSDDEYKPPARAVDCDVSVDCERDGGT